jgi:glucose/arabinose dehydrogenase
MSRLRFAAATLFVGLSSAAAFASDHPGQKFSLAFKDLPAPYATPGVANPSQKIARPEGKLPEVPPGFHIGIFASGFADARWLAIAEDGDVFLAESRSGRITRLHRKGGEIVRSVVAEGLRYPHGMAVARDVLYASDLIAVWKLTFPDGPLKPARRERVTKAEDLSPLGNHITRDLAIDSNGTLYVGIGSASNVGEDALSRATIQVVGADGSLSPFATGIRNPVGMQFYPGTDDLFVTVNERDGLGDGLVPDYLTHVQRGGFYGWPYAYLGAHPDPDYGRRRPDLVAKAIAPDLLFQAHSAPLGLVFYEGAMFPPSWKGDAIVALHGSWNSAVPTGYKLVRIPFRNSRPSGSYENFVTGFREGGEAPGKPARVWGRPAGLAVMKDGSLLIADDVGKAIWRVTYDGR